MGWKQIVRAVGPIQYVHWLDEPRAQAWLQRAALLGSAQTARELDALTEASRSGQTVASSQVAPATTSTRAPSDVAYDAQAEIIRGAWQSLGYGLQALNLRAPAVPMFVAVVLKWLGRHGGGTRQDILAQRISLGTIGAGQMKTFLNDAVRSVMNINVDGPAFERLGLSEVSVLLERGLGRWGATELDFNPYPVDDRLPIGCVDWSRVASVRCDGYTWRSVAWQDNAAPRRAAESNPFNIDIPPAISGALPALVWWGEMAGLIASAILEAGMVGTIERSVEYCIVKNATEARRRGVGGAEFERAANSVDVDAAQFRADETKRQAGMISALAAGVNAIPVAGQILSALFGAAALAVQLLGAATGVEVDEFGRAEPVFEKVSISGSPGAEIQANAPTQVIPNPPGYNGPPDVPLPTSAAGTGGSGGNDCPWPASFASAAERSAFLAVHPACDLSAGPMPGNELRDELGTLVGKGVAEGTGEALSENAKVGVAVAGAAALGLVIYAVTK